MFIPSVDILSSLARDIALEEQERVKIVHDLELLLEEKATKYQEKPTWWLKEFYHYLLRGHSEKEATRRLEYFT
jgi:hypothetical protein